MPVSFRALVEADPDLWQRSAQAWRQLATRMGDHAEAARSAAGQVRSGWLSGPASRAAQAKVGPLPAALSACRGPLLEADQILSAHADQVRQVQARLGQALHHSAGTPVRITSQGQVQVAVGAVADQDTAMAAHRLSTELMVALSAATELDRATARRLRALAELFESGLAGVDGGIPPIPDGGPAVVAAWWASLTGEQRCWLVEHDPARLGSLNGVPSAVRDQANRLSLESARDELRLRLRDTAAGEQESLRQRLSSLDHLAARLDGYWPRGYLLGFDPAGDGRAIVAVGDPDRCVNVATYVPGAVTDLNNVHSELDRAAALQARAAAVDPAASTSVITWLGYDAPEGASVASASAARIGGTALAEFQDAVTVTHDGPIGQQTVLGHSYGSLVVGVADRRADLAADDVVLLASPGAGVDHASELRPAEQVWASTADNDLVLFTPSRGELLAAIPLGPGALAWGAITDAALRINSDLWHGVDPSSAQFGAQTFDSKPGPNPVAAHAGYFDGDNPGLQTMAEIVVGRR